jgi:hypothetical protein
MCRWPLPAQSFSVVVPKDLRPYFTQAKVKVTLLNFYSSLYSPDTDPTETVSSIVACSLVAGVITCPQSCSLATAVLLSPFYTAVTWQRVYMSQYIRIGPSYVAVLSIRCSHDKLQGWKSLSMENHW